MPDTNIRKFGMDKTFLSSSPHETGYVCWSVALDVDSYAYKRVDCELKIADCSDQVHLDFTAYKASDLPKRIEKLDTLITSLTKMRESLVLSQNAILRMELK